MGTTVIDTNQTSDLSIDGLKIINYCNCPNLVTDEEFGTIVRFGSDFILLLAPKTYDKLEELHREFLRKDFESIIERYPFDLLLPTYRFFFGICVKLYPKGFTEEYTFWATDTEECGWGFDIPSSSNKKNCLLLTDYYKTILSIAPCLIGENHYFEQLNMRVNIWGTTQKPMFYQYNNEIIFNLGVLRLATPIIMLTYHPEHIKKQHLEYLSLFLNQLYHNINF